MSNNADRGMAELRSRVQADPSAGLMRPWLRATVIEGVHGVAEFEQYGRPHRFESDEAIERGGSGVAPSPLRYLLASLAFCSQGWIAKELAVRGLSAEVVAVDARTLLDMAGELGVRDIPAHPPWFVLSIECATSGRPVADQGEIVSAIDAGMGRCPIASLLERAVPLFRVVLLDGATIADDRSDDVRRDDELPVSR